MASFKAAKTTLGHYLKLNKSLSKSQLREQMNWFKGVLSMLGNEGMIMTDYGALSVADLKVLIANAERRLQS